MKTLSIITVVYNGEGVLVPTIDSVRQQTYPGIEYVVIDGDSQDNTKAILDANSDVIDILVSEKDKGIYDAMNKGLDRATGDYVLFLNAGDSLIGAKVIENIMSLAEADVYYGETMLINEEREHLGLRSDLTTRKLPHKLTWRSLRKGLVVCHQSIIIRKSKCQHYILGNLSADIDWVITSLKSSDVVMRYDGIISEFLVGGISDQKKWTSLRDRFRVLTRHFGLIQSAFLHLGFVWRWLRHAISRIKVS